MRRFLILLIVSTALAAVAAPNAAASHQCGLPDRGTLWADYADVSFWNVFARRGVVAAAANFVNPPKLRAGGARTVYFDLNFWRRVGSPTNPADPAVMEEKADRLFDYAAASMNCPRPLIALNELFGAATATPWSETNARYRESVLRFVRRLAQRGARPFLLVNTRPYTGGEAADWWREVASYADVVREVYFGAPAIAKQGPFLGSRTMRRRFRAAAADFLGIGIPPTRVGLMLGFQTTPGFGGRERLQPDSAWFEVVKLQAFAARQVARDLGLASVWSWGWGEWSDPERDPAKPRAACVWLWARNPRLCDAPRVARFNRSRTEGQINFARSTQCMVGRRRRLTAFSIAKLTRLTGERDEAYTALFARIAEREKVPIRRAEVLAAERRVVRGRFGGSFAAYRAALARARASTEIARGILEDELRRERVKRFLRVGTPSADDVADYYSTFESLRARYVQVTPAPPWLAGRRGVALAGFAPAAVLALPTGRTARVLTPTGAYTVRTLGRPTVVGALSLAQVRGAIALALRRLALERAYTQWTTAVQRRALDSLSCARDELPDVGDVSLADYVPFLAANP